MIIIFMELIQWSDPHRMKLSRNMWLLNWNVFDIPGLVFSDISSLKSTTWSGRNEPSYQVNDLQDLQWADLAVIIISVLYLWKPEEGNLITVMEKAWLVTVFHVCAELCLKSHKIPPWSLPVAGHVTKEARTLNMKAKMKTSFGTDFQHDDGRIMSKWVEGAD